MDTTSKFKLTLEKELLIGLIVSNDFIKQIAPILNVAYLQASSSKLIARWCLDYYDNYSKAPSELIQDIYLQNKSQLNEEDSIIIAKVLSHISETYASTEKDKFNIPYMIDKASNYIRQRRLVLLQEQLDHDIVTNNLDKAENAILSYNRISKVSYRETNLWKKDVSGIFNTESYQLFKMPKALGQLQGYFRRGNLYAYAGVAKRGKSRWLAQTAAVAALNRCKVLYISLEMDEIETDDLLLNTFIRSPLSKESSEPIEVTIPRFSEENTILYDTVQMNPPTEKMYHKYQKKLSMLCAPIHTIIGEPNNMTLENIEEQILSLEYLHGFSADAIFLDYADILAGKGYDSRDRVNNIWIGLKALAKKYHCAIITATHMNGEALKKDGEDYNIGEDKRKLNHVSGMYILNQTEEEKRDKIMRVKAVATRFGEYTSLDEVVVLYNYAAGRTYIDCRFKNEVKEYQE